MATLQRLELRSMHSHENPSKISQRFCKWTAFSSLVLIAVTWRLWAPQISYPQVPVFQALCSAPAWLDWIGFGGTLLGLGAMLISAQPRFVQIGCALTMVSLLLLFSLDQHRFQPWAYELWLFCGVWLGCRDPLRMKLMRWLLISIYFYSAVGKLDFEFLHTVGEQMLTVVVRAFGMDAKDLSPNVRLALVATFPCIELAVAIGLAWSKSRRLAGWLAIGVHLGLIIILGPLGLNHRLGVLVWNIQVAFQAYLLFVAKQTAANQPSNKANAPAKKALIWPVRIAVAMIGAAIALPSTERLGLWDHWPSWALYAPHSSRVHLEVAVTAVDQLPTDLQRLINAAPTNPEELDLWIAVPIDAWSLQTLDTPIYPQARFQLGVAQKIVADMNAGFQARITVRGIASRFTGARHSIVYKDLPQLTSAGKRFWVNHHSRNYIKAH